MTGPTATITQLMPETISIVRDYVEAKGRKASEKFFWKNSVAAYRWHRRQADQPVPGEKV